MTQLRISNSGQVILQNDVLQHFGLGPGDDPQQAAKAQALLNGMAHRQ